MTGNIEGRLAMKTSFAKVRICYTGSSSLCLVDQRVQTFSGSMSLARGINENCLAGFSKTVTINKNYEVRVKSSCDHTGGRFQDPAKFFVRIKKQINSAVTVKKNRLSPNKHQGSPPPKKRRKATMEKLKAEKEMLLLRLEIAQLRKKLARTGQLYRKDKSRRNHHDRPRKKRKRTWRQ